MKKMTQEEFDALPVIDGIKQCPTADYSGVVVKVVCSFGEWCSFAKGGSFGEWCSFAKGCSFGERCSFAKGGSFGDRCSFEEGCSFREWCSFGERCSFAKGGSFGDECSFGERCSFGDECSFGEWCSFAKGGSFGERCSFAKGGSFGDRCKICGHVLKDGFIRGTSGIGRSGETVYVWNTEDGWFVQTEKQFSRTEDHGVDSPYYAAIAFLKSL